MTIDQLSELWSAAAAAAAAAGGRNQGRGRMGTNIH